MSIEARGLTLARDAFRLGPLDLQVGGGARVAVVGPSGCGKTTLLRCIAGLESAASGTIEIAGRPVFGPGTVVPAEQRRIGFVFQDGGLWPHLNSLQHLRFVAPTLSKEQAIDQLERVGIEPLAERRPATMSGGERQRLALARALAGDPDLLLLDEPLHSVDVHLRDQLRLLIRTIADDRGLTMILVTHDRDDAIVTADDLLVMRDGRVIEHGSTSQLLRAPGSAWTAEFLCDAACYPAQRRDGGSVETVFGVLATDTTREDLTLVVLPGDVVARPAANSDIRARVLQVVPRRDGLEATIELGGRMLRLRCPPELADAREVALELSGPPRLLPTEATT